MTQVKMMAHEKARPTIITLLCIYYSLGVVFSVLVLLLLPDTLSKIATWVVPYSILFTTARLIAVAGLWNMKKWSVFLSIILSIANILASLETRIWNGFTVLVSGLIAAILLSQHSKMD